MEWVEKCFDDECGKEKVVLDLVMGKEVFNIGREMSYGAVYARKNMIKGLKDFLNGTFRRRVLLCLSGSLVYNFNYCNDRGMSLIRH